MSFLSQQCDQCDWYLQSWSASAAADVFAAVAQQADSQQHQLE